MTEGSLRLSWRAIVGVFVCGVVGFGALLGAPAAVAASVLSPSPTSEDFGGVDMHFEQTMQESFFNNSGSAVTVDPAPGGVTVLGDASSFSLQAGQDLCSGATIPSGGSCHVNVLFGPLSSAGTKNATLELTDDTGTVDVPLTGAGHSGTLSAEQTSLDFGSQVVNNGGSAQQSVTLATGRDYGVRVTNVQINGTDASSFNVQGNGCQGFTLGTNNTCQIFIQFQPTSVGAKQAQLEIDSDGNDGTASPLLVSLSGVGLSGPALSVSPRQAVFGNVPVGSSTSQSFTLTNVGDAPLQFQELFIVAGSPEVFPMTDGCTGRQLPPGGACQVTVGFIPIAAGVKDAALLAISNQGPVSIIGLSGTGVNLGSAGATGPAGPPGPSGAAGAAGKFELVICRATTRAVIKRVKGRKRKVKEKVRTCTARLVSGTVKFTISATSGRVTISRGHVVYAIGTKFTIGSRWLLLLTEQREFEPGRYALTMRSRHNERWSTRHATITID